MCRRLFLPIIHAIPREEGRNNPSFVTDGIQTALGAKTLQRSAMFELAAVATIKQYLSPKLIDELHLAFRPILMGSGENLFAGTDMTALGYRCSQNVSTEHALHVLSDKTDMDARCVWFFFERVLPKTPVHTKLVSHR